MKKAILKHRKVIGGMGALFAVIIAGVYCFVVPAEAAQAHGVQRYILVYGHSLAWVFLAGASGMWAGAASKKMVVFAAYAALACYAVFIGTFLL